MEHLGEVEPSHAAAKQMQQEVGFVDCRCCFWFQTSNQGGHKTLQDPSPRA